MSSVEMLNKSSTFLDSKQGDGGKREMDIANDHGWIMWFTRSENRRVSLLYQG